MRFRITLLCTLAVSISTPSFAQDPATGQLEELVRWLAGVTAVTGYEQGVAHALHDVLPGSVIDRADNVVLTLGSGAPNRLVACPLDEPGYVVGAIRDDGFLTLRRVGPVPRLLFDQQLEGQRVTIFGRKGELPGVVAVRSVHLTRGRSSGDDPFTVDDALVDVGAANRAQAEQLGIRVLSPVTLTKRIRDYGAGRLEGPVLSRRAACAAVLSAAGRSKPTEGTVVIAFVSEQRMGSSGLLAVARERGPFDQVLVVDGQADSLGASFEPQAGRAPGSESMREVLQLGLPARFIDTPVETVSMENVTRIEQRVSQWIGSAGDASGLAKRAEGPQPPRTRPARNPAYAEADSVLAILVERYGASGAEDAVRQAVMRLLPAWASTTVDTAGNLWLDLGQGDPTVVVVAHLDEIGFKVSAIRDDGTLDLAPLGGFFTSLFEAQAALVHTSRGPVPAVFMPRDTVGATPRRTPAALRADLGVGSRKDAEALGVEVGNTLTMPKEYVRLAGTRATGRAFDDRVGCTALILAVRRLDPKRLKHRVVFVWSVREEIGLEGAEVVANALGLKTGRVHAIDTFVSADSPLERQNFAVAPLGQGPVARALDNSSVTPPAYVDSLVTLARLARIPLQVGTTNGGNDGSTFTPWGVPDVAIGWPLRYSHSPAEVIDLRDVAALGALVQAIAQRW